MATFTNLQKIAEGIVSTSIDDATPAGHFIATTLMLGNSVCYLLEGKKDSPNAVVKGRIVISKRDDGSTSVQAYYKGGLTGGTYMGRVQTYEKAFAQMA